MFKFLVLILLASPAWSDLAVPATIPGASMGSSSTNGNIVANDDRILGILNQFHSIVESLYYLELPELSNASENFRLVMDSLVEVGSPIFQSLSNVAKISSGNIEKAYGTVRANIKTAVDLNEDHIVLVNQTRHILGDNTTNYFINVLNNLTINLSNVSRILDNIERAAVEIQSLSKKSPAAVNALVPTNDIRDLNAVLRQYILIGDAAVPEIRSVVSRVRTVDSFLTRISNVVNQQRQLFNSSFSRIPPYIQSNVLNNVRTSLQGVRTQITDRYRNVLVGVWKMNTLNDSVTMNLVTNRTAPVVQGIADNVANTIEILVNQVNSLEVSSVEPFEVLNRTQDMVVATTHQISLAMTQRMKGADTCYARYNSEFDKIPRSVYSQLYTCVWDTTYDLSQVAINMNYVLRLMVVELNNEFISVERCTNMVSRNSPDITKHQAVACLEAARQYLANRKVPLQQLVDYQRLFQKEVSYSAERYNFCLTTTLHQAYAQSFRLYELINECLNIVPTVTPMKWYGKVTVGFGK
uniref:Putative 56 kDa salivary secreted protein n=1 Tax=Culex tarsalis TaxID=7177 RepID=A0A1Q3FFM8_CULTA